MADRTLKGASLSPRLTARPDIGTRQFATLRRRARAARDDRHLASLPDRLLDDIGMTRDQAASLAAAGIVTLRG